MITVLSGPRRTAFLAAFALIFFLVFIFGRRPEFASRNVLDHLPPGLTKWSAEAQGSTGAEGFTLRPEAPRANATLGFGTIVATSREDQTDPHSWRRKSLIAAANRTQLHIEIPPPVDPTDEEIDLLMTVGRGPYPMKGSALALHAHIKKLERFLATDQETFLLLEDDADWELDIRELLAPDGPIATGIRNSTGATDDPQVYPFGRTWDLLWLGHCGAELMAGDKNVVTVADAARVPTNELKALIGQNNYQQLADDTREIHPSIAAMCTFGIGITRRWATTFLKTVQKGNTKGVDFSTHIACKGGMRCIGVLPELIHHHRKMGPGFTTEIQKQNQAADGAETPSTSLAEADDEVRSFTFNLKYSARCNADHSDADRQQCLPSQRDWLKYTT